MNLGCTWNDTAKDGKTMTDYRNCEEDLGGRRSIAYLGTAVYE